MAIIITVAIEKAKKSQHLKHKQQKEEVADAVYTEAYSENVAC